MSPYLIIKTGSSLPQLVARKGDFETWVWRGMGVRRDAVQVVDVVAGDPLPSPNGLRGVVTTGSHAMVTEHLLWSERVAAWLPGSVTADIPILGICYGHQLLAYALGGEVGDNPRGREFGTVDVTLCEGARVVFAGTLPARTFPAHMAHTQSVMRLPAGARVVATTPREPHAMVAFTPSVWGVQFHPEFDADVMRAYVEGYATTLRAEGQDPDGLLAHICETPVAARFLAQFAEWIGERD